MRLLMGRQMTTLVAWGTNYTRTHSVSALYVAKEDLVGLCEGTAPDADNKQANSLVPNPTKNNEGRVSIIDSTPSSFISDLVERPGLHRFNNIANFRALGHTAAESTSAAALLWGAVRRSVYGNRQPALQSIPHAQLMPRT